jgi:hypothetical protein
MSRPAKVGVTGPARGLQDGGPTDWRSIRSRIRILPFLVSDESRIGSAVDNGSSFMRSPQATKEPQDTSMGSRPWPSLQVQRLATLVKDESAKESFRLFLGDLDFARVKPPQSQ